MRSGSENGSGRRSVALTTLKIAVLAPMPSASVATTISVTLGRPIRARNPYFRSLIKFWMGHSLIMQRVERIDFRGSPCWQVTGDKRGREQTESDGREGGLISRG